MNWYFQNAQRGTEIASGLGAEIGNDLVPGHLAIRQSDPGPDLHVVAGQGLGTDPGTGKGGLCSQTSLHFYHKIYWYLLPQWSKFQHFYSVATSSKCFEPIQIDMLEIILAKCIDMAQTCTNCAL